MAVKVVDERARWFFEFAKKAVSDQIMCVQNGSSAIMASEDFSDEAKGRALMEIEKKLHEVDMEITRQIAELCGVDLEK